MNTMEIILIAIALAMDAAAVSLAAACAGWTDNRRAVFRLSFHFGLFQFLMPLAGWLIGYRFSAFLEAIDHWIAFLILAYIGGKMFYGSRQEDQLAGQSDPSRGKNLVMLSLATSIDAFAVGFGIALLQLDIWYPVIMIGIITAAISIVAIIIGRRLGRRFGKPIKTIGGIILILLGIKILVEHLFFL